jgi:uracil-DNA glycosylase family 4
MTVFSTKVPYEHPETYKIMFVGEAPGADEVSQGRPFVGRSGKLLRRYIERCRVRQDSVCFANLCMYRPHKNLFKNLLGTRELQEGLEALAAEVSRAKPNVIVALGGWPLWYLTGKSSSTRGKPSPGHGIRFFRGSILPARDEFLSTKVVATFHPAYIERDWKWNPVFFLDLQKAVEESHSPSMPFNFYEEYIDPPIDVARSLLDECLSAEWVSVDIETFKDMRYSCVGWAWKRPNGNLAGLCTTYRRKDLVEISRTMWESPVRKIFQFGTFDVVFMQRFYGWEVGGYYGGEGFDTYVAAANLTPDFPRGLDFLTSIYTKFPYYKSERKVWVETGDLDILWRYNVKDCIATYEIAMKQMKSLEEFYAK